MATTRWYVTRPDGDIDDVGADSCEIREGGTLVFLHGREVTAYAHHAWVSFVSEVSD